MQQDDKTERAKYMYYYKKIKPRIFILYYFGAFVCLLHCSATFNSHLEKFRKYNLLGFVFLSMKFKLRVYKYESIHYI